MLSPPSKCLTDLQRETVKAALDIALKNGQHFDSRNDIQVYLKDMLSKELLLSCGGEIFDCCFHLQADRNRQLPSPSLTDRSQLSTPGQEADNCSENSELGSPSIVANVRHTEMVLKICADTIRFSGTPNNDKLLLPTRERK